ncbi:bacterial Ig-like domain-containing protein [Dehalobacter sp. 4CP]|uniref:bacterial Ig-like domain-containing protein n=1 Tax=Dehalobacter sp. CP TaxID=2594474 RepID=UPI0039EBA984
MKYRDDESQNTVNGTYVGVRIGSPMQDAADPTNDGYDDIRATEHIGTVLQDSKGTNPTPLVLAIEITTEPTKLQYTVGESLDLTGIVVNASFSGGTTENIEVTPENVTGFDSSASSSSQTLTVTVDEGSDTFDIVIVEA